MKTTEYRSLVLCAVIAFAGLLAQYATYSTNPLSSRIGYALFMSLTPAIAAFLILRFSKLFAGDGGLLYFAFFMLLRVLWMWLHG